MSLFGSKPDGLQTVESQVHNRGSKIDHIIIRTLNRKTSCSEELTCTGTYAARANSSATRMPKLRPGVLTAQIDKTLSAIGIERAPFHDSIYLPHHRLLGAHINNPVRVQTNALIRRKIDHILGAHINCLQANIDYLLRRPINNILRIQPRLKVLVFTLTLASAPLRLRVIHSMRSLSASQQHAQHQIRSY